MRIQHCAACFLICGSILWSAAAPARAQTIEVRLSDTNPAARDAGLTETVSEAEVRTLSRRVERSLRDVVLRGALDPRISARTSAPVNMATLEVGEDGAAVGKAKLSWRLDELGSSVDVILKGPIAKSSGVPLTDRGLADGASLTVGYALTLWGSSVSAPASVSVAARTTPSSGRRLSPLEALVAAGLASEQVAAREARSATGERRAPRTDSTLRALERDPFQRAFRERNPQRIGFALRQSGMATLERTVSLSGSYSVGSHTFNYSELADPIVDKSATKQDTAFAVNVAYLQLLRQGDDEAPLMLLSAGYTSSDAYTPRKARQICTPLAVGAGHECRALIIGAPKQATTDSVELDVRSWAYAQKLGVNPHFSYDRTTRKWTSELDLSYLVLTEGRKPEELPQLRAKALTVGVRVGKRPSEDGGPFFAVFFGTVLGQD